MFIIPLEKCRSEITVVNSRFIASLAPCDSVESARAFISYTKKEFCDASHNVPAFIIGGGNTVTDFCSDDGEPSGTSGRPLLSVLKGSGLGNVCIVVTRYFGGTLLGTGGLVKAYSAAGKAVLAITKKAELIESKRLKFSIPYNLFDRTKILLSEYSANNITEEFLENVTLCADIANTDIDAFFNKMSALSCGSIVPEIIESKFSPRELLV